MTRQPGKRPGGRMLPFKFLTFNLYAVVKSFLGASLGLNIKLFS